MLKNLNILAPIQKQNLEFLSIKLNKKFQKVKLNYMSALSHTPPVKKIPVSSNHIEELRISIKQKTRQNLLNESLGELDSIYKR